MGSCHSMAGKTQLGCETPMLTVLVSVLWSVSPREGCKLRKLRILTCKGSTDPNPVQNMARDTERYQVSK